MIEVKCDICGSTEKVERRKLPMYRMFDGNDGLTRFDHPHIEFQEIDICEECLRKATNIFDQKVMGYGDICISISPELKRP